MRHPFFEVDHPIVIGHRGAGGEHPENTLPSFEAALAQGAAILESDVHRTRDGVPILLHDPTLERLCGVPAAAADLTWAEIARLDAGVGFVAADGSRPFAGRGIRIASLEQAFAQFPDARFNLEIKCAGPELLRETLDLVARHGRAERTLLTAGEDPIMADLRRMVSASGLAPALGASLADVLAVIASALEGRPMPRDVMALQIPATFAGRPLVTPALVDHAHAHGVEVHVWTINALPEIEALLDLGVDGIVTDFPGRMARWLADGHRP
ncbi:MAG: glycerophosphodiester phosphodiesterase [Myxococcota bacterium]